MEFMMVAAFMIVFAYPVNKLIRFVLGKSGVPEISKAWLAFIILLIFQLINLLTKGIEFNETAVMMTYSIPSLLVLLIVDLSRNNPDSSIHKNLNKRWARWVLTVLLFIPVFAVLNSFLASFGIEDIYYLYTFAATVLYFYIFLKKKKVSNAITHSA